MDTNDNIANADTDADVWGGSIDVGYVYGLNKTSTIEPYISLAYSYINYDNLQDNIGNFAEFEDINYFEAEVGLKLEKAFYNDYTVSKVYIRPSVIQTFGNDATVRADNVLSADALDHNLYGKLEIGVKYGITENLSVYGGAYYMYGDDYDAQNINLGLTYSW